MGEEHRSLGQRARFFLKKVLTTQVLGVDYADGLVVIGRPGRA